MRGVVYGKGRNSSLVALDAATGKEIWIHDGLEGMTRRGINYWESKDGKDRRLIFSISDYLQEIDAATGKSIRTFGNNGVVDLREGLGRDPATIGRIQSNTPGQDLREPAHPRLRDGRGVLLAARATCARTTSSPASSRGSSTPCRTRASSATRRGPRTRGNTSAAPTRGARSRSIRSAAIAYFPTGSGTFDFYGADRIGANLFADCLIALDARTGKRLWHFQNVHHDLWDYDNTSAPQLTTIKKDGKIDPRSGDGGQDRLPLRVQSRDGRANLADRGAARADQDRSARRTGLADAAVPHEPAAVRPAEVRPGRCQSVPDHAGRAGAVQAADCSGQERRPLHADRIHRTIHMPGNNGGSNFGSTSSNPNDGTVYVISYDIPAIMRLLTPEEAAARGGRGRGGAGAAAGRDSRVFQRDCQACHGADRAGTPNGASLVGVAGRLAPEEIRSTVTNGKGRMPPFPHLLATRMSTPSSRTSSRPMQRGRGGRGRGGDGDAR